MTRFLGEPLSAGERAAFVAAARSYIGVRWRHQGRSRKGIDCGGLVSLALADIGRIGRDIVGYGRVAYHGYLEACLRDNFGDPGLPEAMQIGDVALISYDAAPNHVGIVADYLYGGFSIIHAHAPSRKVIEHRLDERLRVMEIYRP